MLGREPVAVAAAISVAIKAIFLAVMAFGFTVTAEQLAAVMFAVDSLLGLGLVLIVRPQVVPTDLANSQILTATRMPEGTSVEAVIAKNERDSK